MKTMARFTVLLCLLGLFISQPVQARFNQSKAGIDPESPEAVAKRLEWWQQARFGMFIHWGLYAHDGCHWKGQYGRSEHMMMKLQIPIVEYEKIADAFNPVKFDADQWVSIARDAGMKYMVITAKHHDGFAMYDSPCNSFNIIEHGPWKRDPLKELSEACQKQEIEFGVYYSLGRDWHDPNCNSSRGGWRSNTWDYPDEDAKIFADYFEKKVKPQITELLTQYDPAIIWFDTYEMITAEQSEELRKLIHDINPACIINSRIGHDLGDYSVKEQKVPETGEIKPWESCMTLNQTWGYNKIDHEWKTNDVLIRHLIDIVSKGGNFLLNVGPTGQGIIPEPSVVVLKEVGDWLKVNGQSIYGATAARIDPPQWGRYTSKPGLLYVHVFDWPEEGRLLIGKSPKVAKATLLADPDTELVFSQTDQGIRISLPAQAPDPIASVIRLELTSD